MTNCKTFCIKRKRKSVLKNRPKFAGNHIDLKSNSDTCQTSKLERPTLIVNSFLLRWLAFIAFAKRSILDAWQDSEYASETITPKSLFNKVVDL